MKLRSWLAALGLVSALGLGFALAAPAEEAKPEVCFDKARCVELIGYGREAFNRGKFSYAKGYFREAVKSDPSSAKAWAFYDLTVMYEVADQVKNTGSVKVSGAPLLGPGAQGPPVASGAEEAAAAATEGAAPKPPPAGAPPGIPVIAEDEGC